MSTNKAAPDPLMTLLQIVTYLQQGGHVSTVAIKRDLGLSLPALRAAFATQPWYSSDLAPRTALLVLVYGPAIVTAYREQGQSVRAIAQVYALPVKDVHAVICVGGARRARPYLEPEVVSTAEVTRAQAAVRRYGIRRATRLLGVPDAQLRRLTPGVTLPNGRRSRIDDAAIRAQYIQGTTIRALARTMHCTRTTIMRSLRRSLPLVISVPE